MRLFKRKSLKAGYANISEPVSDLDPARISAIKARHSKTNKNDIGLVASGNDDTFITETNTLDTSPSAESINVGKLHEVVPASSSQGSPNNKSLEKKLSIDSFGGNSATPRLEESVKTTPSSSDERPIRKAGLNLPPRTPETFFEGKNRKRVNTSANTISASHAISERPAAAMSSGGKDANGDVFRIPERSMSRKRGNDAGSQVSDLDKTFSPQIVSVNSDITEPSYGLSSRRKRQQQAWKKVRKLRRYLHESFNPKNDTNTEAKNTMSFLDMIIDAICSYPGSKS